MHRAGYLDSGIDARYLPIEADDAEDCLGLSGPGAALGIEALAVTMPFKHDAHARCKSLDEAAQASGAVNTVLGGPGGWRGCNTDGPAVLDIVRARFDPRGEAVAVVGAGGFARAAAVALRGAGADVVLFNRTRERADRVAQELGVTAQPLDDLAKFEWTVLVQATPLGLAGEDPLEGAPLRGKLILDAIYGPETPLLRRARLEGTDAVGGFDLLVGQAVRQFELMVGVRPSEAVLRSAGRGWLKAALTETSTGLTLKNRR
jgi:shikimate dehydrogenase